MQVYQWKTWSAEDSGHPSLRNWQSRNLPRSITAHTLVSLIHSDFSNTFLFLSQLILKVQPHGRDKQTCVSLVVTVPRCMRLFNSQRVVKCDCNPKVAPADRNIPGKPANTNIGFDANEFRRARFGMKTEEIATLIKSGMCSSFPARLCHSLPSALSWGRMPWPYAFTPGFRTKPGFVPALQAHHNLAVQAVHCQSPSSRSLGPPVHPSWPVSTRLWLSDSPPSVCCVS